jgi:hypothetical protein
MRLMPSLRSRSGDGPRRRAWHWVGRVVLGLVGAVAILLALAHIVLVHFLGAPFVKRPILRAARSAAGLDIDYATASVDLFSGATLTGVVVRSPEPVRALAPELARVGRVDARWSLGAILRGEAPLLRTLSVSDVDVVVVIDENGKTTFDALPSPSSPSAPVPMSHQASAVLGAPLPLGSLDVDHVRLTLLRSDRGAIAERDELSGVGLHLTTGSAAPASPGSRVDANLGSLASPLELELARVVGDGPPATARAKLSLSVGADSRTVSAVVDLRMVHQSFASTVSADRWLHAEADARFDPAAGTTEVLLSHAEAGDGAARVNASLAIPDRGDPLVKTAHADVDVARLLGWLPPGLVPISADRAQAHVNVDSLVTGPAPSLGEHGVVVVEVALAKVAISAPGGPVELPGATSLRARATPSAGGGVAVEGSLETDELHLSSGAEHVAADGVVVDFAGQQAAAGVLSGKVAVRFARLAGRGASPVSAHDGRVEVHVERLQVGAKDPAASRGDVTLSAQLGALDVAAGGTKASVAGLSLQAHSALAGGPPFAGEVDVRMTRLLATRAAGEPLVDGPVHFKVDAREIRPDASRPEALRGAFDLVADVGDVHASIGATKGPDSVEYQVQLAARSLAVVSPLLPPDLAAAAPWNRMALAIRSSGHVGGLFGPTPAIRHDTQVDVDHFAFRGVSAQSAALRVTSQGTALQHEADLDLRLPGLTFGGTAPSDDHLALKATLDRTRPSLSLALEADGRASAELTATLSFDSARRALVYDIGGRLSGLAALSPFTAKSPALGGFDLSELGVHLTARGAVLGFLASLSGDGSFQLEPGFTRSASVEGTSDLEVTHFKWARGDTGIIAPSLSWHADMRAPEGRRTVESHLKIGTLHLDLGVRDVDLTGIRDTSTVTLTGDLADPRVEIVQSAAIGGVTQDLAPEYPMGDLALALSADRGPDGVVHIGELRATNAAAGTKLALSGNIDLGEGRRTLSLDTSFAQDLSRLSTVPERFKGTGELGIEAAVTSPDFFLYKVKAAVRGEGVSAKLPRAHVEIVNANGEVPITVELAQTAGGLVLERSDQRSPYSMLRFADQHPLLARSGFLSIDRVSTPFGDIARLVGNLDIDQNIVSLRQFEMGVRHGTITGQLGLDWEGAKSTVELHVRASGVQSSHGEPFDGNIAVAISAADRSVQGRAEILRIGPRHLLDLLDLQDPLHADPAYNQIRGALNLGYPEGLRVEFDHGFASAHIQLGGVAKLITIPDLRGIRTGPIIDHLLAPSLEGHDTKEAP